MIDVLADPVVRDIGGMRTAYADTGSTTAGATPLVLLHGGAVDHRMWARQLPAFAGRRVIAPDARGHGASSSATAPHRLCDDVIALLDDLGIERVVLVGLSMGGGTAVDAALEHPERVAGLVVSGTGTSEPDFSDPWTLDVLATWQRTQAAGDAEGWIEAFLRFVAGPQRDLSEVDADVTRSVERMVRQTLAAHLVPDESGAPRTTVAPTPVPDTWARLQRIDVPVLAVAGSVDSDDHVRMVRRLAETVEHGRFVAIEGSAHYPNMERPDEFNAAVHAFLSGHDL